MGEIIGAGSGTRRIHGARWWESGCAAPQVQRTVAVTPCRNAPLPRRPGAQAPVMRDFEHGMRRQMRVSDRSRRTPECRHGKAHDRSRIEDRGLSAGLSSADSITNRRSSILFHSPSPKQSAIRPVSAAIAASSSGPSARVSMLMVIAFGGGQHHHAHDTFGVDFFAVARDRYVARELPRELRQLGRRARACRPSLLMISASVAALCSLKMGTRITFAAAA